MGRRRSRPPLLRRFTLWACTFLGGAVAGAGAFLWVQVRVVRYVRQQVADINVFERLAGKMTFLWRSLDEKLSLALADIPEEYLEHSTRVSFWLMGLGLLGVAFVLPWYFRRRWQR